MSGESIAAFSSLVLFFVLGFLAFVRYLRYKETVALAERRLIRAQAEHRDGRDSLRWGIIIAAVGLALSLEMYPIGFSLRDTYPLHFGPWMLVGLIPTFFGVALILIHVLTGEQSEPRPDIDADEPGARATEV